MSNSDKKEIFDAPYLKKDLVEAETMLGNLLRDSPLPNNELAENSSLYLSPRTFKRQLFFNHLYRLMLNVHGDVGLFGIRWGRDMSLIDSLRTIYEPFNVSRRIIGFDTFEGFPSVDKKDKKVNGEELKKGYLSTTSDYISHFNDVLSARKRLNPLPTFERNFVFKGNAIDTLRLYLKKHPETIFSLIYFDFDLYEPTIECLKLVIPFLTKGSILGFDELNSFVCPGETIALREVLGTNKIKIERSPEFSGHGAYIVWG